MVRELKLQGNVLRNVTFTSSFKFFNSSSKICTAMHTATLHVPARSTHVHVYYSLVFLVPPRPDPWSKTP